MLFAAVLCLSLSILYIYLGKFRLQTIRKARIFLLMGLSMTLFATIFSSSLSIALGWLGAISFIRFRLILNDLEWLAFIFLSIAIGIACGTGKASMAILGFLLIASILLLREWIFPKPKHRISLSVSTQAANSIDWQMELQKWLPQFSLQHCKMDGVQMEWIWDFQQPDAQTLLGLQNWLMTSPGVIHYKLEIREDGN